MNLHQSGPRVNLSERNGVDGLRIRHESLSIFLDRDQALTVASRIADLLPMIPRTDE